MRSKITGDVALQFGGEVARLEAVMDVLLKELSTDDKEIEEVCNQCGQKLPLKKECC